MLVIQTTCVSVYLYTLTLYFYTWLLHTTSKCVSCVQDADLYGHGGHSPAFVPTFGSVLPTKMVRQWQTKAPSQHNIYWCTHRILTSNACLLLQSGFLGKMTLIALQSLHEECAGSISWLRAKKTAWPYICTCNRLCCKNLSSCLHWLRAVTVGILIQWQWLLQSLAQRCQNVGTWALVMTIWRGFINWFASYHIWWASYLKGMGVWLL